MLEIEREKDKEVVVQYGSYTTINSSNTFRADCRQKQKQNKISMIRDNLNVNNLQHHQEKVAPLSGRTNNNNGINNNTNTNTDTDTNTDTNTDTSTNTNTNANTKNTTTLSSFIIISNNAKTIKVEKEKRRKE
jgi:hypothetical protein